MNARLICLWILVGLVASCEEAPDEETATALMLHLGSFGNVRTQTARAFNAEEMDAVLGKLPQ